MKNRVRMAFPRRLMLNALCAAAGSVSIPAFAQSARSSSEDPILIGQSIDLSGPLAEVFSAVLAGQRLALDEFNARGGVGGRPIKLVHLDDAYDVRKAIQNIGKLVDEFKVTALFGLTATGIVEAALPIVMEKQVPLIGVYTGSPSLRTKANPFFFTTFASYGDEVVQIVRHQKALLLNRIGLVYLDNPLGHAMLPLVKTVTNGAGISLVASVKLAGDGGNAAEVAQTLAAARPQSVLLVAVGPAMIPFVKHWKSAAGTPIYALSVGASSKQLIDALGNDSRGLAFAQPIPSPYVSTSQLAREFNALATRANVPVDYHSYYGFINARVLIEGLKRAGRGVTRQSLVAAMESMGRVDLGGYTVSYSQTNHHGSSFADITAVAIGGRFVR